MKKSLLTLALTAGISAAAFAQGTVYFSNTALSKLSTSNLDGTGTAAMTTSAGLEFGLFYGIGSSASMTLISSQFGVSSTSTAGIVASPTDGKSAITLVGIPNSSPNETDVYLQFGAWSASYGTDWQAAQTAFNSGVGGTAFKLSNIANVPALGASSGPGISIWQGATQTNPKLINAFVIPVNPVPEPTSLALLGLGAAGMMIFRRRK